MRRQITDYLSTWFGRFEVFTAQERERTGHRGLQSLRILRLQYHLAHELSLRNPGLSHRCFLGHRWHGGGILIIPALVYLFHMSQHKAQGTSLGTLLLPIGALAFWEYYKAGNADIKAAALIALGFFIGGYFGGLWAQRLPEAALQRIFGALLVIIRIRLVFSR